MRADKIDKVNPAANKFDADDKIAKANLVIETITKNCASSPHAILQQINQALSLDDGSKLKAKVLSGGYTNYSYKVFVDQHPEICVFGKLCFEFAGWNPDRTAHYDLQRTENEMEIMKTMSKLTPEYVASPLGVWDVVAEGQRMKLIVTTWAKGDEQFSNQFIDGVVDPRIAPKLAETLAELHSIKDFDPEFNVLVKPAMENLFEKMNMSVEAFSKKQHSSDRTQAYCADVGTEAIMKVMRASVEDYHTRDCLIHSDSHVFNILVEAKPSIKRLEQFGPEGSMLLCDWEMAMAGPKGRDVGLAISFPVGCMVAHAFNGNLESNKSIQNFVDSLWGNYASKMEEAGKTKEEIFAIHRNLIGWCGWFQFAFYFAGGQLVFPVDSEGLASRLRDSMGILGLKLMRLCYDTEYVDSLSDSEQLKKIINSLIQEEVNHSYSVFLASKRKMQPRKSPLLGLGKLIKSIGRKISKK